MNILMSKDTVLGLLTTLLCATFLPKDVPVWASEYTMPFKSLRAPLSYYRQLLIFIAYIFILIYPLCHKGSLSCISPSSTPFCVTSLNPFISVAASKKQASISQQNSSAIDGKVYIHQEAEVNLN
jgi:hypothetical protein